MKLGNMWFPALSLAAATISTGCTPSTPADDTAEESAAAVSVADPKQETSGDIQYLLVQTAPSIRYSDGKLTLESVHDMTLYFADRPERTAGWLPTSKQISDWGTGDDSFAADPPNADLSIVSADEDLQITVVLTNPLLADGNLTYDVEILEGEMPETGGPSSLFIDIVGAPMTPVSVAGVARRSRSRTVLTH